MKKIDVTKWLIFSCAELFECKNTGNVLARDIIDGSGHTPYVTASGINNGVIGYIDASNYQIIKGNCILVGGKTFTVTYQNNDFISNDSHNFVIRAKDKDLSVYQYEFLVTVIRVYFKQRYSWNDAVTAKKFLKESIPLPSDANKRPDWTYMNNFMKAIYMRTENNITILNQIAEKGQA